jgi:predicted RNase H-like nuclease
MKTLHERVLEKVNEENPHIVYRAVSALLEDAELRGVVEMLNEQIEKCRKIKETCKMSETIFPEGLRVFPPRDASKADFVKGYAHHHA